MKNLWAKQDFRLGGFCKYNRGFIKEKYIQGVPPKILRQGLRPDTPIGVSYKILRPSGSGFYN